MYFDSVLGDKGVMTREACQDTCVDQDRSCMKFGDT